MTNAQTRAADNVAVASDNSLRVVDKDGKQIDFAKVIFELSSDSGQGNIAHLRNIDELRQYEPTSGGEFATVLEYSSGSKMGGGLFVYDALDKTTADDGGLNFKTPKGARWKRVVTDYNSVTVVDFGAIADGETDCLDAVTRMFNWSQKFYPATGIRFTAGKFKLSKFDISTGKEVSRFKVSGAPVNFGYFPTTTLYSDRKNDEVMFKVNARYTEISGLVIEGQSDSEKNEGNTKGFFRNIATGGQFVRVSSMQFRYVGGRCLELLDTLDCKIDQFYSSHCENAIIYARWSNREAGSWDHSTAIELSNFNIQSNSKHPALDIPRCTQSFIRNGWIEHSEYPGDLTNGQWVIEGLVIESTENPLKLGYCRALIIQKSIHRNSAGFDFSKEGIEPWALLDEADRGIAEISDLGAVFQGSLNYDFITSQHRMDNQGSSKARWFYVGEFRFSNANAQIHVRVLGTAQFLSQGETQTDYSQRTPEGMAHLYLQARSGQPTIGSWYSEGSSPVEKVHIEGGSGDTRLYIKVPAYTAYVIALVETNSKDRYQGGLSFVYRKSHTLCTDEEGVRLDAAPVVAFEQHWTGNKQVGFGYNNNKELLVRGTLQAISGFDAASQCLKVRVNGTEYGIELKKLKSG